MPFFIQYNLAQRLVTPLFLALESSHSKVSAYVHFTFKALPVLRFLISIAPWVKTLVTTKGPIHLERNLPGNN